MAKGKYRDWLKPENLDKILEWSRDGLTDKQISDNMGIGHTAFYAWLKKYPEMADVLTRGRAQATDVVENALFERAQTKVVKVMHAFKVKVVDYEDGKKSKEREEMKLVEEEEVVPGDTKAAIYWLSNRRGSKWKSNPEPPRDPEENAGGIVEIPAVLPSKETPHE